MSTTRISLSSQLAHNAMVANAALALMLLREGMPRSTDLVQTVAKQARYLATLTDGSETASGGDGHIVSRFEDAFGW